jgi:hypothetical protein
MSLWIPPAEAERMLEQRQRYAAGLLQQRELHSEIAEWNRTLKEIDPHLEIVKAPDNAHHSALKPGYWHIIRHGEGEMPPAVLVHEGPEGEYRDPDSSLLERLRKGDMWSSRSMKAETERERKAQRAAERAREREREERVEELYERARHHFIPKIAVPKDIT